MRAAKELAVVRREAQQGKGYVVRRMFADVDADVYVLVDGQLRFQNRGFTNDAGPFPVQVPLADADRFLTLVTTDGGDQIGYDWVLWVDPTFALSPASR